MSRKLTFIICLIFLLPPILCLRVNQLGVKASNGYTVHNLNTGLNYTTIQEAIDAPETLDGHQILVESGIYEPITIDKSIMLIGSDMETTIISGTRALDESVIEVLTDSVAITRFTIQNGYYGISVDRKTNISIVGNKIQSNEFGMYYPGNEFGYGVFDGSICDNIITQNQNIGVYLVQANNFLIQNNNISFNGRGFLLIGNSDNNAILGNTIHGNGARHFQWAGLHVTGSGSEEQRPHNTIISDNSIYDNNIGFWMEQCVNTTMRDNRIDSSHNYTFGIMGTFEDDFYHNIDASNTIDGKPVYYIVNQDEIEISKLGEVGYLGIVNCTNIKVHDINLSSNSYVAMQVAHVHNSTIANITIQNSFYSMYADFSSKNLFTNISISNNFRGICISNSNGNSFINNAITYNEDLAFSFYESSDNIFQGNKIEKNDDALTFYRSADNEIFENNIIGQGYGYAVSFFEGSSNNTFIHNNFINNSRPVQNYITGSNVWDDGLEGNYWSSYNGTDLYSGSYRNETGSDGIGDTEYGIDGYNTDHYPLMQMFSEFDWISIAAPEQRIQTICNSTISNLVYDGTAISFDVTGDNGTSGFCRIRIPKVFMNSTFAVFVNGTEIAYTLLRCSNENYTYVYFNYTHSTEQVIIIPEFPSILILPTFMLTTLAVVVVWKWKRFKFS